MGFDALADDAVAGIATYNLSWRSIQAALEFIVTAREPPSLPLLPPAQRISGLLSRLLRAVFLQPIVRSTVSKRNRCFAAFAAGA